MEWKYVKPLQDGDNIWRFEQLVRYTLPEDYKACVQAYNGGRPSCKTFVTESGTVREMKCLLSYNESDRETVWKIRLWNAEELGEQYVAVCNDNFGNLICFRKDTGAMVFLDHETLATEYIAQNFSAFLQALR